MQVEVEKKDSDEEPMEMVVEKQDEPEPEAEADPEGKHVSPILADKMAEDLKPMDTDKESLAESKSPEESIQEDSGSDIAPMQTDEQLKQVPQIILNVCPQAHWHTGCASTSIECKNVSLEIKIIAVFFFTQDVFVPGPNEKPLFTAEPLTLEDLSLLAELFYLPYEHGPKAMQMLKEFNWLRANSSTVSVNCKGKDPEKVGSSITVNQLNN